MTPRLRLAAAAAVLLTLAACDQGSTAAEPVVLIHSMKDVLAAESNEVINTLIDAMGDQGEVDAAKLSDEDWAALTASSVRLRDEIVALRDRPIQVVAAPGDMIEGQGLPGGLTAEEVQARIDAAPAQFSAEAAALMSELERMALAAERRDAEELWDVALHLDERCVACHTRFWYRDEGELPPP